MLRPACQQDGGPVAGGIPSVRPVGRALLWCGGADGRDRGGRGRRGGGGGGRVRGVPVGTAAAGGRGRVRELPAAVPARHDRSVTAVADSEHSGPRGWWVQWGGCSAVAGSAGLSLWGGPAVRGSLPLRGSFPLRGGLAAGWPGAGGLGRLSRAFTWARAGWSRPRRGWAPERGAPRRAGRPGPYPDSWRPSVGRRTPAMVFSAS